MNRILTIGLASAALLALSACGGQTSHATCKDEKSTMEYTQKWTQDLTAAATAGKLTMDKLTAMQKKMTDEAGKIKGNDFGAVCVMLDNLRKEAGI